MTFLAGFICGVIATLIIGIGAALWIGWVASDPFSSKGEGE